MRVRNFNKLAEDYLSLLRFGRANRDTLENFIWRDGCVDWDRRGWFQQLTSDEDKSVVELRRRKEAWVIALLKQDPIKFAETGPVVRDIYSLLLKHRGQLTFADRILSDSNPVRGIANLQTVHDSYMTFLDHCL